jgi:hypothetical protein
MDELKVGHEAWQERQGTLEQILERAREFTVQTLVPILEAAGVSPKRQLGMLDAVALGSRT